MEQEKQLAGIDIAVKVTTILLAIALLGAFTLVDAAENYKFDFGEGPVATGYTQVKASTKYSDS
jgi:hypothetical protein